MHWRAALAQIREENRWNARGNLPIYRSLPAFIMYIAVIASLNAQLYTYSHRRFAFAFFHLLLFYSSSIRKISLTRDAETDMVKYAGAGYVASLYCSRISINTFSFKSIYIQCISRRRKLFSANVDTCIDIAFCLFNISQQSDLCVSHFLRKTKWKENYFQFISIRNVEILE